MNVFALVAAVGFFAAYIGPSGMAMVEANADEPQPLSLYSSSLADIQTHVSAGDAEEAAAPEWERGNYTVYVKPKPTPVVSVASSSSSSGWAPPFVTPDPGTAQAIALEMVRARGWGDDQFSCLVALWKKESGWRVNAYNRSSGAYGIPQSLPGNKMAKAGADWQTNPATQIRWGLGYISGRYGNPCGAWAHSQRVNWY